MRPYGFGTAYPHDPVDVVRHHYKGVKFDLSTHIRRPPPLFFDDSAKIVRPYLLRYDVAK